MAAELNPAPQSTTNSAEMMKLLLALNEGVKSLGKRFNDYQQQVDRRFDKVNAEVCLLRNRVDMIEQHSRRMALLDQ